MKEAAYENMKEEIFMEKTVGNAVKGGSFLVDEITIDQVFTPEDFSSEHKMIAKTTEDFIVNEVLPELEYLEQHEFDRSVRLLKEAGELGLLGADVPEEYGGIGLDKVSSALIAEKFSRAGGFAITHGAHVGIGSLPIVLFGNEEQKKKYLPKCVSGEITTAIAMSEPGIGSDLAKLSTTAIRDGDHYIVNGEKTFISNGLNAGLFFVAVKTDLKANPARKGISILLVDEDTPGFSRGKKLKKLGQHSADTVELIFEDARVPVANLLGDEGKGFYYMMEKLQQERLIVSIGAVAVAEEMLKSTMSYVKERQAFGKTISSFQNTQFEIAEMATELSMAQTFIDDLTSRQLKGENIVTETSMAKWFITEMARTMSVRCLQLYGGYGYMEEYPIARRYRDVAVMPVYAGTTEIMKNIIAKNLGL